MLFTDLIVTAVRGSCSSALRFFTIFFHSKHYSFDFKTTFHPVNSRSVLILKIARVEFILNIWNRWLFGILLPGFRKLLCPSYYENEIWLQMSHGFMNCRKFSLLLQIIACAYTTVVREGISYIFCERWGGIIE